MSDKRSGNKPLDSIENLINRETLRAISDDRKKDRQPIDKSHQGAPTPLGLASVLVGSKNQT